MPFQFHASTGGTFQNVHFHGVFGLLVVEWILYDTTVGSTATGILTFSFEEHPPYLFFSVEEVKLALGIVAACADVEFVRARFHALTGDTAIGSFIGKVYCAVCEYRFAGSNSPFVIHKGMTFRFHFIPLF